MSNIYDEHTVCVKTKFNNKERLVELLELKLSNAEKLATHPFDKSYIINFVVDKNGSYKNMAFVYFSSSETYKHMTNNTIKNIIFELDWCDERLSDADILQPELLITKAYVKENILTSCMINKSFINKDISKEGIADKNVLSILNIPKEFNNKDIKDFFMRYSSDITDQYPYVDIKSGKQQTFNQSKPGHHSFGN